LTLYFKILTLLNFKWITKIPPFKKQDEGEFLIEDGLSLVKSPALFFKEGEKKAEVF